jgi:hypothetical protein
MESPESLELKNRWKISNLGGFENQIEFVTRLDLKTVNP